MLVEAMAAGTAVVVATSTVTSGVLRDRYRSGFLSGGPQTCRPAALADGLVLENDVLRGAMWRQRPSAGMTGRWWPTDHASVRDGRRVGPPKFQVAS